MRKYILLLFLCLSILSFCHAQYNLVGAATETAIPDCIVLTQNEYDISGALWFTQYVNINNGFDIYSKVYLGNDDDGADGIAFVLQQVSSDVGSVGGGIGYEGLVPSVVLELDTYANEWDPRYDHIALMANGQTTHQGVNSLVAPRPIKEGFGGFIPDMEDGQYHDLRVSWDPNTQIFNAYIDCELRLTYTGDIVGNIFNGNPYVFWGFTSATGGRRNEHRVCLEYVSFTQQLRDVTLCKGASTMLNATNGTGVSYSWFPTTGLSNPNIATPIASPDVTTTYTVTIYDPCGNTRTDDVTVNIRPSVRVDVASEFVICENESVQLSASGGLSYQWVPTTGLDNPNISSPMASPSVTTTYMVTGTDDCGNVQTDSVTVRVQSPMSVEIGEDMDICASQSVLLSAVAENATTVSWSPTVGLSAPNILSPIAFPDTTTTYIFTATDNCGNIARDSLTIYVQPIVQVSMGEDKTICAGESVQLDATIEHASSISWSPALGLNDPNIANPMATPDNTTTYVVAVTDECGNTRREAMVVNVRPSVEVEAGASMEVCQNEAVQLNANVVNASSLSWSPTLGLSDPTIPNPTASLDSTITYTLTGTDECGNIQTDQITITIQAAAEINAGEDMAICPGESIQMNATVANATQISWSPALGLNDANILTPIASPNVSTTYVLTAIDNCGNAQTDTISVNVQPTVSINAGEDVSVCSNEQVQLDAVVENGNIISWTPALTLNDATIANPIATPESTTTYVVSATDACGVIRVDSLTIMVSPTLTIDSGADMVACENETIQLNAQITNANDLIWSPTIGLSDPTIANPTVTLDSTVTYTLTATDECGNTQTDQITVNIRPSVRLEVAEDMAICPGESVQLSGSVIFAQQFQWEPALGLSATDILDPLATPEISTTYVLSATDECGNIQRDSILVTVHPLPEVFAGEDVNICENESVQLDASTTQSNNISWAPEIGLDDVNKLNPMASPILTTTYTLTSISEEGCINTDKMVVTVNSLPNVDAGEDVSICIGESINLEANGAQQYIWKTHSSLNNVNVANPSVSPTDTYTYSVEGTDENGCGNMDSVTVSVNPLPLISLTEDETLCEGESTLLMASGGVDYSWYPIEGLSDPQSSSPIATPSSSMSYTVTGIDANNCTNTASIDISITPRPQAEGGGDVEICAGNEISLQVNGGETYAWSTGESKNSIQVSPNETTTYWVVPITKGCTGDTVFMNVDVFTWPTLGADISDTVGYAPLEVYFSNLSTGATTYVWDFGDGNTSDIENPTHTYDYPGIYAVKLSGQNKLGCETEIDLGEIEVKEPPFAFPNAFTPNGDGINDEFDTRVRDVERYHIMIFNRWGHRIFETTDPMNHWDGTYKGSFVPEGVYVFSLKAQRYLKGKQIDVNGTVTLIR